MTTIASVQVGVRAELLTLRHSTGNGALARIVSGLPEHAARETHVRVKAALHHTGITPAEGTVVAVEPELRHGHTTLDLAVAVEAVAEIPDTLIVGELSLSGLVLPTRGVYLRIVCAYEAGIRRAIVPDSCQAEACAAKARFPDMDIRLASTLQSVLSGETMAAWAYEPGTPAEPPSIDHPTLPELEAALSAGRHVLLVGSPGSGKTMLARRARAFLPPLSKDEQHEVYMVRSAFGAPPGFVSGRPFRAPHHTASEAALVGGGFPLRPGEITLAHRGVLFLDELPEFRLSHVEATVSAVLRKAITLRGSTMPCDTRIIAAMDPCPCGYAGADNRHHRRCECSEARIKAYRARVEKVIARLDPVTIEVKGV